MARVLACAALLVVLAGAAPANGKVDELYALRFGAKTNLLVPYDPVRLVPSGSPIRLGQFGPRLEHQPRSPAAGGSRGRASAGRADGGALRRPGKSAHRGHRHPARRVQPGDGDRLDPRPRPGRRLRIDVDQGVRGRSRPPQVDLPARAPRHRRARRAGAELARTAARLAEPDRPGDDRRRRSVAARADGRCSTGSRSERPRPATVPSAVSRSVVPRSRSAPAGQRAFVIGAGEPPASIDLRTLSVRVRTRSSHLGRQQAGRGIRANGRDAARRAHRRRRKCLRSARREEHDRPLARRPQGLVASSPQQARGPGSTSRVGSSSPEARAASVSGSSSRRARPGSSSAPAPSPASPSSGREPSSPSSART